METGAIQDSPGHALGIMGSVGKEFGVSHDRGMLMTSLAELLEAFGDPSRVGGDLGTLSNWIALEVLETETTLIQSCYPAIWPLGNGFIVVFIPSGAGVRIF